MHVTMNGNMTLREAHEATTVIEDAIMAAVPMADVTVHMEPAGAEAGRMKRVRKSNKRLI
jgi:divalent metal cation (Fe/Co/Zn/Cd) transporter